MKINKVIWLKKHLKIVNIIVNLKINENINYSKKDIAEKAENNFILFSANCSLKIFGNLWFKNKLMLMRNVTHYLIKNIL